MMLLLRVSCMRNAVICISVTIARGRIQNLYIFFFFLKKEMKNLMLRNRLGRDFRILLRDEWTVGGIRKKIRNIGERNDFRSFASETLPTMSKLYSIAFWCYVKESRSLQTLNTSCSVWFWFRLPEQFRLTWNRYRRCYDRSSTRSPYVPAS